MINKTSTNIIREIDTKEYHISLNINGIVYVVFKDNCEISTKLQVRLLESYKLITQGKLMPFMFLASDNVSITKEARDNAILIEELSPVGASAVVVDSLTYKLIANFYLKFNKPKRPYKVFKNEYEAEKWLSQFKFTPIN